MGHIMAKSANDKSCPFIVCSSKRKWVADEATAQWAHTHTQIHECVGKPFMNIIFSL